MTGKIIGNYKITGELAQGGMGAIYRGHHIRLPREVVIKSILLDAFSPSAQIQLKARFRREACVQSQLDHENIVRVYEFFETEDNYYLVMEYVPGMSLRALLDKQGVPTPEQTVFLFRQILTALDYAHTFNYVDEFNVLSRGIIHRDINPANLLLDNRGRMKITDFGAVKLSSENRLTQSGFHPGTIEYMSPEQLRGWEIDSRSDIYSVGVTFYEMLTGQVPFPRQIAGSDWEVRKGHIELNPAPIHKLRPAVPPQLAAVVMRALQKDPGARYQTAKDFLVALDSCKLRLPTGKLKHLSANFEPEGADRPRTNDSDTISFPEQSSPIPLRQNELATTALPSGNSSPFPQTTVVLPLPSSTSSALKTSERQGVTTRPLMTPRGWALSAAATVLLMVGAMISVYLFSQQPDKQNVQASMTTIDASGPAGDDPGRTKEQPAPAQKSQPSQTPDTAFLKKAIEFEIQERYEEAIVAYESHLWRNPGSGDLNEVTVRIADIRRVHTLIETAKAAADRDNLTFARQCYADALKIKPHSKTAQTGLAEIERRIAATVSSPR